MVADENVDRAPVRAEVQRTWGEERTVSKSQCCYIMAGLCVFSLTLSLVP